MIDARIRLYIPHGSDESNLDVQVKFSSLELYIPHGSDERMKQVAVQIVVVTLYPTWFR